MSHDKSSLSVPHLKMLREESGISDLVIELRGYRTITDHRELSALGFASRQLHVPGVQREQHARVRQYSAARLPSRHATN
jgi:hypothetical protein